MSKIKKPISIVLALMMVVSLFAIVPITASAAVGDFVPETEYLTFTAEEAGSSVTLNFYSGSNLQYKYNKNNSGWQSYTKSTQITLASAGDSVRFRGNNTTFNNSNHVSIGGKVACSGNVMSLRLDDTDKVQGLSNKCFEGMFTGCTGLTAAPKLPETKLADNCYSYMFSGCTSLTTAPALPATTLTTYCYNSMFDGCESLTTAPALPATTLAVRCYNYMFSDCKSLTTAPALPATTLATHCYYGMFYGCTSLTAAPALPATELVTNCYASMFNGCTGIKLSTTQTAEYSIPYSVPSGGNGTTTATNALNNMFANTGGTFTGKPTINTTYYMYVPKYTVTWKNGDTVLKTDTVEKGGTPVYSGETPVKAEDANNTYTFSGWTDGTNTYGKDDSLPAVTGDIAYTATFDETAKTFKAYVKKLTGGTYTIENLTGETTVAQLKEIIADQIDIPATAQRLVFAGKELEDAKTLAAYNIGEGSTIHLIIRGYTVTWLNYDNSELGTKTVQYGATPTYDGETPEKGEDENYTYTFSGWSDGTNTYGASETLPAVTGDITYTAQFDKTPKAHQHDGITFEEWTSADSLPAAAGNYVLTSDVTLSGTWTVPEGETNLCLAGYTIRQSGSGSVILLDNDNKKLTVYDDGTTGTITGGNTNNNGGGVNITAGTFTLKGGNIEGNVANNGGGVSVIGQSSYFTMTGGTIRYNSGYGNTGGVLLVSTDNFTMTGGEIRYNVGRNFGGIGIANAHPNMSGTSVVKDNVVFNDTSESNTKITKTESGFTLAEGGTPCDIKDSTVNGLLINVTGAFESGAQIGIFNNNQTAAFTSGFDANNPDGAPAHYFFSNDSNRFVMLSENKEAQLGGYFTVIWKNEDGTVLETDENVSTGTTPEFNGTEPTKESDGVATFAFIGWTPAVSPVTGDVTYTATYNAIMPDHEHDGIVYKGWASKNSLPTEAGNYYLGYDVTLSSTWTVSTDIRLCLNGNGIAKSGGNVITIVGGNLTIDDCGDTTHYFDVDGGKAVNVNTTPGENRKSFTGGYITGGTGQGYDGYFWGEGGGIYLDGGNLILNGGTILGNRAVFGGGVGIFSGTMTMNGGTVCYNTGNAGISFRTGSNEYNRGRGASTGYFVMNGGLVANNNAGVTTAGYSYGNDFATYNGGKIADNVNYGIYSNNITIAGDIEITGNKYGAGFRDTCSISGNPVITGNNTSNLSINNGKTINTGTFGENARIGITMNAPGVFTTDFNDNNTLVPTDVFTADDPVGSRVINSAEGEGELEFMMVTASFNAGDGSGTIDPIEVQKGKSFNLPECTFTAPEGKLFLNWSDGTNTYNAGDSCTLTADTEFTAQWMDGIKVSFKANGGSGVMEDVYSYPDYKLPACGFTAPEGKFFIGWRSSADKKVYQTGDTVTLTDETQFTAQWRAEVKYQFDFEDGLPDGWQTSNNYWFLNADGGDYNKFPAHSGQKNMTYYRGGYNTYGELLTSSFDMTNAESATLGFWYTNRDWSGDLDQLVVSYRVGEGEWKQIFATDSSHESWTNEVINLPAEAFAKDVQFRFHVNGHYGYGIALDDVELNLTGSGKDLFTGHSVTLDGDIGVNFFINSTAADFAGAESAVVKFTWDDGSKENSKEVNLKELNPDDHDYYKASVDVVAAQMAHMIHAEVYLNGEMIGDEYYSVQDYAEAVFANPAAYDDKGKPEQLKALAKALLNYGAMAQTVFDSALTEKPELANKTVGNNGYADVTAEQIAAAINGEASDLNEVATQLGAKYYTNSLIYLSKNTLRIYFTPTSYPGEMPNAGEYTDNLSGYYYYVDHANIPAAELDDQQTFTVGDTTFNFSALDYAKAVVNSGMGDNQKNLAKSLYLYNQAANAYFV